MLVEKQEWFARLIAQGVSNSEACRIVGINRRTGTRWRYGRTILNTAGEAVHYPPVRLTAPKARHPRYLSLAERTTIADLHRTGISVRGIAEELGRAASTVSRELHRNTDGRGRYLPATAHRLSTERQSRSWRTRRVTRDDQLHGVVAELLGKRWSPEQVAHELRLHFPGQTQRHLCAESIYQAIYDPRIDLTRPAKRRRQRRRRRIQGLERRGRMTSMTMIADRPAEAEDRMQVGHWEGDCIMGAGNRSAIGTLVERTTRFVILIHVPTGRPTAETMRDGISGALGALAPHLRRTLTWDQGKELALHQQITAHTGTRVYFCDAHSLWQLSSLL
jgi:transposase, IS30 family